MLGSTSGQITNKLKEQGIHIYQQFQLLSVLSMNSEKSMFCVTAKKSKKIINEDIQLGVGSIEPPLNLMVKPLLRVAMGKFEAG